MGESLGRMWRLYLPAVTCVFMGVVMLGAGPVEARGGARDKYKEFPLWLEVPAPWFAVLDEGRLRNGTRWGAYISRFGRSEKKTRRPCITVARITKGGENNSTLDCGVVLPGADVVHPVYASITENYRNYPRGPELSETVMGLIFDPGAARVVMTLASGGQIAIRPRLLNAGQQNKARVPALRYVAVGLMRNVCIETVTGYDSSGSEMFAASTDVCP